MRCCFALHYFGLFQFFDGLPVLLTNWFVLFSSQSLLVYVSAEPSATLSGG